jgi:glycosyltransferase involved in cell wall biosynthesis
VGRFFRQMHSKKQDILVTFFKKLLLEHPKQMKGWKLVLIGSVEDKSYAEEVKEAAADLPIEILHQVDRKTLLSWYQRAEIYWHATGFGIDQDRNPEKVEHFGITTVEAMSFGCAPVVINKGGQPEVLGPKLTSLLWNNEKECIATTIQLVTDSPERAKIQHIAHQQAKQFGRNVFDSKLNQMIS